MIFNLIGLIIGILILAAGIYYYVKEKEDQESRKIYGITSLIGGIILLFIICKIIFF